MDTKVTELTQEKNQLIDEYKEVIKERNTLRADNKRLNSVVNALTNKLRGRIFTASIKYIT